MDPRHKLYKQLDSLAIDPELRMSAKTDTDAAQEAASSGITPEGIRTRLEEGLGATHVEIEDMSGRFDGFLMNGTSTSNVPEQRE